MANVNIMMDAILNNTDMPNVIKYPEVSANHPPTRGATIAAGASKVFAKPMYAGRSESLPNAIVMLMAVVHMVTLLIPIKMKTKKNQPKLGAANAINALTAAVAPPIARINRCPIRSPTQPKIGFAAI